MLVTAKEAVDIDYKTNRQTARLTLTIAIKLLPRVAKSSVQTRMQKWWPAFSVARRHYNIANNLCYVRINTGLH